jgi:hypothetical protein
LANAAYELGEFLSGWQQPLLAEVCYQLAFRLCPGSRIEKLAAERLLIDFSNSAAERTMTELINESEDLRQVEQEWVLFWCEDEPSNLTPPNAPQFPPAAPTFRAPPATRQTAPATPPPPPPVAPRLETRREPQAKQVMLSVTIAEVPRGRFLSETEHVKVLKPVAQEKLLQRIQTLRDKGKAKMLGEPRLTTLSGQQASFLNGFERAIEKPDGVAQASVEFEQFGTRVSVTPIVLKKGKLRLEIEPEVSRLDPAAGSIVKGVLVPGRATERLHTAVEMKDGQTVLVGGLAATHGGDKPKKRLETIILVTPRVTRPEKKAAAVESPE